MAPTAATPARPSRLALALDFREEGWPSMDLVGEMIASGLADRHRDAFEVVPVRPPYRPRLARWPAAGRLGAARNADRLLNRFWDYPRSLAARLSRERFDVFHLVDHSYSQLLHVLPADRAVVTCHDLDTFRCLLEPGREPRPRWFRAMTGRILDGFRKAAAIVCVSGATRRAILSHGLADESRLHLIPNGISPEFSASADPEADREAAELLGRPGPAGPPELLHVGTTIPRKRIDVLLEVVAAVRRSRPDARLVRAGAPLTAAQRLRAEALGLSGPEALIELPRLDRRTLAAVYRRAALVLQPSEAEGFGLPVAEALACGAPVLASDLEALREVGGGAVDYRPVADVPAWADAALGLLARRLDDPEGCRARRAAAIDRASGFSWSAHVDRLVPIYRALARGEPPLPAAPG